MSLTILDVEQGSEAWHDARRGIVTASTVGKLITPGLKVADNEESRNLTRLLAAERITGHTDPTYQSDDMFRGVLAEPVARDYYSQHHAPATECGFMVRNDDWGFSIGYSPDGAVGDDGLIEIKAPRSKEHLRTILANRVPDQYMPQLQCGLLVSGRKWVDYVSYCAGMPLWVKRVKPDEEWFEAILEAVDAFEVNVWAWVAAYEKATEGLPATERIDYMDVELKL